MTELTYPNLKQHLAKKFPQIAMEPQGNQLLATMIIGNKDYPFFVRIFDEGVVYQLIAFIPCSWHSHYTPQMAQLLHLLNKELEIPGFGLDDTIRIAFFRAMLFAKNSHFDEQLLDAMVEAVEVACETFTPVITQVANGELSYLDVVRLAKEKGLLSLYSKEL